MTDSQLKVELTIDECFRLVLISVCDPTIVARAPAYTRELARPHRTRVLRPRWKIYKKIADTH